MTLLAKLFIACAIFSASTLAGALRSTSVQVQTWRGVLNSIAIMNHEDAKAFICLLFIVVGCD
jgi:hypothetical protein